MANALSKRTSTVPKKNEMLTSGLRVLTPDAEAPRVPQTTMRPDLLQPLEIVTELRINTVGQDLRVLAVGDVALSVEEPGGDLVLGGVLDDGDDTLELFGGKLTGAVGDVSTSSFHVSMSHRRMFVLEAPSQ